jgi:hypothetical protein
MYDEELKGITYDTRFYLSKNAYRCTVIPRFTSLIRSSKSVRRKLVKRKLISHYFPTGTTMGLREEGACRSKNWLVN